MNDLHISEDNTEDVIDFDNLDSDPKEQAKLQRALEISRYKRNIMGVDEFNTHYAKLFRKDMLNTNPQEYKELSQEYLFRIDPYYPVFIVKSKISDKVSELLKQDNVVYTLPPVYNRVGMVNNLGTDGLDIMLAFNNLVALNISDPFNKKKELYSKYLGVVFKAMNDEKAITENRAKAKQLTAEVMKRSKNGTRQKDGTFKQDVQDIPEDMLEELGVAEAATNDKIQVVEEEEYL